MESRRGAPKTPRGAPRYGDELKRDVTEYGRERQKEGALIVEIAKELGLSAETLQKWMKWAKTVIAAGKVPFAPKRKGSGADGGEAQGSVRGGPENQQGEAAERGSEGSPEPSAGNRRSSS
jgi:transposase-like protein